MPLLPPLAANHKRAYIECKTCAAPGFYDYTPDAPQAPMTELPCGCPIAGRFYEAALAISRDVFIVRRRALAATRKEA